jgi:hypothetical protein
VDKIGPDNIITILGSGIALGTYIPCLLLRDLLYKQNIITDIEIIENLYDEIILNKLITNKYQYHKNARIAIKAHQLPHSTIDNVNRERKEILLQKWYAEKRRRFIIISGFWSKAVEEYIKLHDDLDCHVDCIHMDSVISSSWSVYKETTGLFNHIWPFSYSSVNINNKFNILNTDISHYGSRKNQFVVHGGGWGMGNSDKISDELRINNIIQCRIFYYKDEILPSSATLESYYLDESWYPWRKNNGEYTYPRLFYVDEAHSLISYASNLDHKILYIILDSKAIISKPGGATLLDSLETETPIIFLNPVGAYEKSNALLWVQLGFGYYYDTWKESNFSSHLLLSAHLRLKEKRNNLVNIGDALCSLKRM